MRANGSQEDFMNRWLSVVVSLVIIGTVGGCNNPVCGPGTVQVQGKNNKLTCQPVDVQAAGIPCDVDGGAQIVGGKCVSAITCGKNTTLSGGVCVGSGGGGDAPPVCPTPDSGKACVNGLIRDFLDSTVFKSEKIHVALYDPLAFIGGAAPISQQDVDPNIGGYVFPNFTPPPLGLIAVVTGDPDFTDSTKNLGLNFVAAASGAQNVASGTYRVDVYALKRTTVDGWGKTSAGGVGWYTSGGYVSKFYSDLQPDQTDLEAIETHPIAGVTVTAPSGSANPPASGTVYFSTDLSTVDTSLNATTTGVASAITPPPPDNVANFSGSGGVDASGKAITWETQQGGSAAHIIFISRYHPIN
jgi:hypothetical protein